MRGAATWCSRCRRRSGIIPACAGSRPYMNVRALVFRDHPRVCGEQSTRPCACTRRTGSSPRVRGAVPIAGTELRRRGIIPACAGSSAASSSRALALRDHPRVCGEQFSIAHKIASLTGSSPRVRGAAILPAETRTRPWIIPACAGSSNFTATALVFGRDHPRVCGEQEDMFHERMYNEGSSPRVRGAA